MNIDQLDYVLPPNLIATHPATPRDAARLLVVHCSSGQIEHSKVRDLPNWLDPADLLVRNDSSVLAARLMGQRAVDGSRGGGRVEGLFLCAHEDGDWTVLLTAGGKLAEGQLIVLHGPEGEQTTIRLKSKEGRYWRVSFESTDSTQDVLSQIGRTPLPPYILKARRSRGEVVEEREDREWYRTIFARADRSGSVAAPTAGLHFTPEIDARITELGVRQAFVTLHVGEGTFRPVTSARLEDHKMHFESWCVDADEIDALRCGPKHGGRMIAVGTTTTRVLESLPKQLPDGPLSGDTDLLISPGHAFRRVDGLLTNFHLPRSTLLALVAAFTGLDLLHEIYSTAIEERYRFYSYGDAMLVVP
jgi:S-adenosylmethionine:tRNA ribosyltransferase-isomerase